MKKNKIPFPYILVMLIILFMIIAIIATFINLSSTSSKFSFEPENSEHVLARNVSIGDFVNYDAGIWTEEEILSLDNTYSEEPTVQGTFGKFTIGTNRNNSIEQYGRQKNKYNGWRVLKIVDENDIPTQAKTDDTVYLIHAGSSEVYYHIEGSSYDTEKILTGKVSNNKNSTAISRNWDMYVNKNYATNATCFTKTMLDELGAYYNIETKYNKTISNYDLIKAGASYWLGEAFNQGFVWRVSESRTYLLLYE